MMPAHRTAHSGDKRSEANGRQPEYRRAGLLLRGNRSAQQRARISCSASVRDWTPRISVVFSDPDGAKKIANFESKDIDQSVKDQIIASGARPVLDGQVPDYTLYLNTPNRKEDAYLGFQQALLNDIDGGKPVSVADINLGNDGTADPSFSMPCSRTAT